MQLRTFFTSQEITSLVCKKQQKVIKREDAEYSILISETYINPSLAVFGQTLAILAMSDLTLAILISGPKLASCRQLSVAC